MIGYALNRLAKGHKVAASAGGALLGYMAASPFRHPFAALAALGIGSEYLERKKEANAMAEARKAALMTGTVDKACRADPHSAECVEHVKTAAVASGQAAMRRGGMLRVMLAWLFGIAVLANAAHGDWSNAVLCAVLFLIAARPYLRNASSTS